MQTVQNTSIQSSDYRDLPVAQLVESPTNPRKRYDQASLQELAESIRAQGVLAPLLVREVAEDRFEVVAGSRRFRAARLAGAASVPVRVVELSDAEAILAQVVENLQRENIHPLEEAQGFRALLDLPDHRFDIPGIAAKAGKNPQYVAQRLKLTELIPPVADAFLADKLTIGHALLIAKLPPAQQAEAVQAAFKTTWMTGGQTEILLPVKDLAAWIESNLLLDLQTGAFDRSDAALIPEAGSCHACSKRTGANCLLFPEADRDQCLDRECYQAKINAHVAASIQHHPDLIQISTAWGTHANGVLGRGEYIQIASTKSSRNRNQKQSPEQKKCAHMKQAIVVEGGGCGRMVYVCANLTCDTHHTESRKERETQERMRKEQHKQDARRKQELVTRRRVLAAILEKVSAPLSKADLGLVAEEFFSNLPQQYRTLLIERHGPAKDKKPKMVEFGTTLKNLDETSSCRLLIELSLLDAAHNPYPGDGAKPLEMAAKRYRVNIEKIAEAVAAEFATRRVKREQRSKVKLKRV